MPPIRLAILLIVLLLALPAGAFGQAKQPTAIGTGGAAATVDVDATRAAIRTLRSGGNAVDAAVAAAGVLGVTEPFSCGIGGGGFMVIRTPDGRVTTIDSRETAPGKMHPRSFTENRAPLSFADARWSGLSAGVPGTVRGWQKALRRHGTWSLRRALRAGIETARDGFVVDGTFASQIEPVVDYFNDVPSTAALYLDADGTARDPGTVLRNPDLARTYRRIADFGPRGFYRGPVAEAMVAASTDPPLAADANHVWRPGVMTDDDLRSYRAVKRPPTRVNYHGLDVYGMGPPSSGGSTVGEALNILEGFDLSPAERTRALHLFLEASRFSFADRNAYLADSDFVDVPLRGLLSDRFAAERRALIDPEQRRPQLGHSGRPAPRDDASDGERPQGNRGVVHVHDRVHRRQRHRRARLGIPAQQRADRLQLRLAHPSQQGRGRQAAAQLDEPHDRARSRPALPGRGLSRRIDDHHHRAAGAAGAPRARRLAARRDRPAAGQPAQRCDHDRRAGLPRHRRAGAHVLTGIRSAAQAEIGAATGIEFLRGGRVLAAAEPMRRGGGSAAVERP